MMIRDAQKGEGDGYVLKEAFEALGGIQRGPSILRWLKERHPSQWEDRKLGTYLRGCSVNRPKAMGRHPSFPRFLYSRGNREYEIYDLSKHGAFDAKGFIAGEEPDSLSVGDELREEIAEQIEDHIGTEFAYEAHLRDYLAKNLSLLEIGLTPWHASRESSVEYQLEGRRIDILAKDKDGVPVVIELKLSKGHERTIGQALYYRAKLKQILSVPKVRIVLVAAEITDELRLACSEVTDVDLFQYSLTMQLDRVKN